MKFLIFRATMLAVACVGVTTLARAELDIAVSFAAAPNWVTTFIDDDGRYFHDGSDESYIDITTTEFGHDVDLFLATDDEGTPRFQVAITSPDTWLELYFPPDDGVGFFNPYRLPESDWTHGTHLLPPSEIAYTFSSMLQDRTCYFDGQPCSQTKPGVFGYEAREIPAPLPGDANRDGRVGFDDFLRLSRNFGADIWHNPRPGWVRGDFNLNGVPDFDDFLLLQANFGATRDAPPQEIQTIPEPTTRLLPLALLALGVRRRRSRRSIPGQTYWARMPASAYGSKNTTVVGKSRRNSSRLRLDGKNNVEKGLPSPRNQARCGALEDALVFHARASHPLPIAMA